MGVQNVDPVAFEPAPLPGAVVVKDLNQVVQTENNWCWAACTIEVLNRYHRPPISQCDLASMLLDPVGRSCCVSPGSTLCDAGCPPEKIKSVYQSVGIACDDPVSVTLPVDPAVLTTVRGEIVAQRPVEIRYTMGQKSSHAVIISGYVQDGTGNFRYFITDSLGACGWVTSERLPILDDKAIWTNLWTGLQPLIP